MFATVDALSKGKVNKTLSADLTDVEAHFISSGDTDLLRDIPMIPVSFRPRQVYDPFGSETLLGESTDGLATQSLAMPGAGRRSVVVLQLTNPGPIPADFVFRMPHELAIDKVSPRPFLFSVLASYLLLLLFFLVVSLCCCPRSSCGPS